VRPPEKDHESEWVTVFDALGMEIAHIIKARLESEDLPVMLRFETMATFGLSAGFGVQVQVPRAFEDQARAVLDAEPELVDMDGDDPDGDDPDEDDPDGYASEAEDGPGDSD
jgi:hypothetical protein